MFVFGGLYLLYLGSIAYRYDKLAKLKLKRVDTPEKEEFMRWVRLSQVSQGFELIGATAFILIVWFVNLPAAVVAFVLILVPSAIFGSKAKKIIKSLGFTEKDAYDRKVTFASTPPTDGLKPATMNLREQKPRD